MAIFNELSQLIFPSRCFGCATLASGLCFVCAIDWQMSYFKTALVDFSVHSSILYSPVASKIIVSAKEGGVEQADEILIATIIFLLDKIKISSSEFRLVPIPSSKKSVRRRGRSFIVDLSHEISRRTGISTLDCLGIHGTVADQSGLTRIARQENMRGAFHLTKPARGKLILIDDVITTGATLKEAARAIHSGGFHAQITAITACVAQPLR
jgi:predicted amidophosphoribosyltransferase